VLAWLLRLLRLRRLAWEAALRRAAAEEREACARVAECYRSKENGMLLYLSKEEVNDVVVSAIAASIRRRCEE
jgi:hypothetical protein